MVAVARAAKYKYKLNGLLVGAAVGDSVSLVGIDPRDSAVCFHGGSVVDIVRQNALRIVFYHRFLADDEAVGADGSGDGRFYRVFCGIHIKIGADEQIGHIYHCQNRQRGNQYSLKQ